jgi:hypothetical protein
MSRDTIVGIETGCGLDDRGIKVRVPVGAIFLSSPGHSDQFWGSPPVQWVPGALSTWVKRLRHEADHSPPTSAEVKNAWIYTSSPPHAIMV